MAPVFRCSTASPVSWDGDALAVGLFAGEAGAAGRRALAACFGEALLARLEQRRFKGKPGECLNLERLGETPATLLLLGHDGTVDIEERGFDVAGQPTGKAIWRLRADEWV